MKIASNVIEIKHVSHVKKINITVVHVILLVEAVRGVHVILMEPVLTMKMTFAQEKQHMEVIVVLIVTKIVKIV